MPRFLALALGCLAATAASCGDEAKPLPYGLACTGDAQCESKHCIAGYCSKLCSKLADCPSGSGIRFTCGEVEPNLVACLPNRVDNRPFTTGHDCSLDGKCAGGWKCMGALGGYRYCSPICENDHQCPTKMRCASVKAADADEGEPAEKRCMPRKFGHPCVIDDQCPNSGDACITDLKGKKYCSKACTPTSGGTCPVFAKCQDAGNGNMQCKYNAGYAYDTPGSYCDPCIYHDDLLEETGTCQAGGRCLRLSSYTNETACVLSCADTPCPDNSYWCTPTSKLCIPIVPGTDVDKNGNGSVLDPDELQVRGCHDQ